MGVKLADLQRDKRTIEFPVRVGESDTGEELTEQVTLTYRPSKYTGKTEKELNALGKDEWKSALGLTFITTLVISWDVQDEDDTPFPLEIERLSELPSSFVGECISAIADDMGKVRRSSSVS